MPQSKRRSISISNELAVPYEKINPKKGPPVFIGPLLPANESIHEQPDKLLKTWKVLRYLSGEIQKYPPFAGWVTSQISLSIRDPTVMMYIPSIQRPITDYETILEIFRTSRKLAKQSNMQHMHITFDNF